MNEQEFCQNQVEKLGNDIQAVREEIERLMQVEETLLEQQTVWRRRIGRTAVVTHLKPRLTVLDGGKE